jgi:hypothetical protein
MTSVGAMATPLQMRGTEPASSLTRTTLARLSLSSALRAHAISEPLTMSRSVDIHPPSKAKAAHQWTRSVLRGNSGHCSRIGRSAKGLLATRSAGGHKTTQRGIECRAFGSLAVRGPTKHVRVTAPNVLAWVEVRRAARAEQIDQGTVLEKWHGPIEPQRARTDVDSYTARIGDSQQPLLDGGFCEGLSGSRDGRVGVSQIVDRIVHVEGWTKGMASGSGDWEGRVKAFVQLGCD